MLLIVTAATSTRRQNGTAEIERPLSETQQNPASSSAHDSQRDMSEAGKGEPDAVSTSPVYSSQQDTAKTEEDEPVAENTAPVSLVHSPQRTFKDFSLIFTYIDKGLGDFYWTINIYREILDIRRDSPVCIVACVNQNAQIDAVRKEHTNFAFRDVDSMDDVVLERDVFYVLKERSIRADQAAFGKINALAKTAGTCICFDTCSDFFGFLDAVKCFEYDYKYSAILFRDYSNIPLVNGYRKTDLSPADYRNTLPACMQERFDVEKIARLVPDHEYTFCYFYAKPSTLEHPLSHLVMIVSEMMRLDGRSGKKVTVLSNFDVNRLLQRETLENASGASETPEKIKEMVRCNLSFFGVDVDFDQGTMWLKKGGPVFQLVCYGQVTEPEFEYLLLRSGEIAGCTGDMSVSQVLSTGRIMVYQCLGHKEAFVYRLEEVWKSVNGHQNRSFTMFYASSSNSNNRKGLPKEFDTTLLREQYRAFLARIKENDFRKELERKVLEWSRDVSA